MRSDSSRGTPPWSPMPTVRSDDLQSPENKLRDTLPSDRRAAQLHKKRHQRETDIDGRACIAPPLDGASHPPATGLVLARGRFDQVKSSVDARA